MRGVLTIVFAVCLLASPPAWSQEAPELPLSMATVAVEPDETAQDDPGLLGGQGALLGALAGIGGGALVGGTAGYLVFSAGDSNAGIGAAIGAAGGILAGGLVGAMVGYNLADDEESALSLARFGVSPSPTGVAFLFSGRF